MRKSSLALVGAVVLGTLGCGSGSSTPAEGRHVTWTADGVALEGIGGQARSSPGGGSDALEITGFTSDEGFAIALSAPTLSPGTFDCSTPVAGQTLIVTYFMGDAGQNLNVQTCKIVLTQIGKVAGDPVVGTFEATFSKQGGGTTSLMNGSFNLPLIVQ